MKKLLWKLERNGREYSVVSRQWNLAFYYIIFSPIFLLCFIFNKVYFIIQHPLRIRDSRVICNGDGYDKLTRKQRNQIFKRLTKTL